MFRKLGTSKNKFLKLLLYLPQIIFYRLGVDWQYNNNDYLQLFVSKSILLQKRSFMLEFLNPVNT